MSFGRMLDSSSPACRARYFPRQPPNRSAACFLPMATALKNGLFFCREALCCFFWGMFPRYSFKSALACAAYLACMCMGSTRIDQHVTRHSLLLLHLPTLPDALDAHERILEDVYVLFF
jgi:hypothetical protein